MSFVLEDSTGYLVNRLAAVMKTSLERELEPFGVTAQQWAVMATVNAECSAGVAAIADRLGVDVGAASRLIDRLEQKKLVARRRAEHDARQALVTLLPAGRALLPKLLEKVEGVLAHHLKPLSNHEVRQFNALVRRLLEVPSPIASRHHGAD